MNKRTTLEKKDITKAIMLVKVKIGIRLKEKGRGSYIGNHETYGILAEEFNKELLDALCADDDQGFHGELLDIVVGGIFGMASMYANKRALAAKGNSCTIAVQGKGQINSVEKTGKVTAGKTRDTAIVKTGRGRRPGPENPSSQYLGVTVKTLRGDKKKYHAQIYRDGINKYLGRHNSEELAAAAVQEHLGNKQEADRLRQLAANKGAHYTNAEEASRLRKLAEQKTDQEIRQLKQENEVTAWDCKDCGQGYRYKPDQCGKCNGTSFTPARQER